MTQAFIRPSSSPGNIPAGSNSSDSKTIHQERVFYRSGVFYEGLVGNLVNTWGRDRFYGKINTFGNAVYPLQNKMKTTRFSKGSESFYTLGFVADAWRDFAEKMRELANNNIIHRDSPWAAPQVHKAYQSPQLMYHDYLLENVYPAFLDNVLDDRLVSSRVRDLGSFMNEFNVFMDAILFRNGPLTFSAFLEGSYASPLVSGLMIEISGDRYDDDATKAIKYRDQNFELAANIASQYGFSIDMNIPWRLVANLSNPAMQEYMVGVPISGPAIDNRNELDLCDEVIPRDPQNLPDYYGFSQIPGFRRVKRHINVYRDEDGFTFRPGYLEFQPLSTQPSPEQVFKTLFQTSYGETWHRDIEVLAVYMLSFYNTYAQNYPILSLSPNELPPLPDCNTARRVLLRREQAPEDIFSMVNGEYRTKWALKTYYNVRMAERNQSRTHVLATRDLRQIMSLHDATDGSVQEKYDQALRYTQQNFVGGVPGQALTLESVSDILDQEF